MANAMKCDRCGKLYESYNTKKDNKNINGFIPVNLDVDRKYYSHGVTDLCPDCMKEFQNWMKEVKYMERLTEWIDDGEHRQAIPKTDIRNNGHNKCCNKLAEYEDLEEQGLLVRLPCKVGDTMYDIIGKPLRIVEHKVDAFHIDKKGFHLQIINGVLEKKQEAKVYFSREEAKKKLEEMKKND